MSDSLLTQAEINALMEQNRTSNHSQDQKIMDYFHSFSPLWEGHLNKILGFKVSIDGFYIEKVIDIEENLIDNSYVFPVDFPFGATFVLLSEKDAHILADQLNVSIERSNRLLVEEFIAILSKYVTDQTDLYQQYHIHPHVYVQNKQLSSLSKSPSYVACYNIGFESSGIELYWFFPGDAVYQLFSIDNSHNLVKADSRSQDKRTLKKSVKVEKFAFANLQSIQTRTSNKDIALVNDVSINIIAELGRTTITLGKIMELQKGEVIHIDKAAGEPSDVYVNDQLIAKAEIIVVDDNFGLRILEINSSKIR